jgi:hypothetical protein
MTRVSSPNSAHAPNLTRNSLERLAFFRQSLTSKRQLLNNPKLASAIMRIAGQLRADRQIFRSDSSVAGLSPHIVNG